MTPGRLWHRDVVRHRRRHETEVPVTDVYAERRT